MHLNIEKTAFQVLGILILMGTAVSANVGAIAELKARIAKDPSDIVAIEQFKTLAKSANPTTRGDVAACLGRMSVEASDADRKRLAQFALPLLGDLLSDEEQSVRREAAAATGDFGEQASGLTDELAKRLGEGNVDVAWFAAESLGSIGADARAAVPALIDALDVFDKRRAIAGEPQLAVFAAEALGKIGFKSPQTLSALSKIARNEVGVYRVRAAEALIRIDPAGDAGFEAMEGALRDNSILARRAAADSLAGMTHSKEREGEVLRLLRVATKDGDESVRQSAQFGLESRLK